ncbi:7-alpha-hydroxycholest-4-en-3-one 12-alpha-hydroxylase-like [Moniliophthora roreri MCA 2997]|uniref:7-alpha-hydroxycholest-4-en-3-one 12-alpha-hydroxylase-like n=2 Tax=Moniliophthora roreri TaxID=221103 RepID=V2XT18_MONRO|nr:7-alpha-hydroxycholest-4-en-3-one 12-alpha-hydroxylase-like [Moniliophthora roreri MCA 2997]
MLDFISNLTTIFFIFALAIFYLRLPSTPLPKVKSYASQPPLVPSLLPWLGHALSLLRSPPAIFKQCRERYGSIYKLAIPGRRLVLVSDPIAIASLQVKSPKEIGYFEYQKIGPITGIMDEARVSLIFEVLHRRVFALASHGMSNQNLSQLTTSADRVLLRRFQGIAVSDAVVELPLQEFVGSNLYAATVMAFFGPHFSPESWSDFAHLDRNMYYLLNWIPFHGKEGREARSRVVSHIDGYLKTAWSQDEGQLEGVPDFVSNMVGEMVKSGLSLHEQTTALLMILWGMNGNVIQVVFWTLSYLMAEPDILKRVTADIRNAVAETVNDVEDLLSAEPAVLDQPRFKLLDSLFQETMRLCLHPTSIREALCDTVIAASDNRLFSILKGEQIIVDIRGLHLDPSFFPEPEKFKFDRFLHLDGYPEWQGVKTFVPWGGGLSMCKGRNYARHIYKIFLILCLDMFDIEVPPEGLPLPAVGEKALTVPMLPTYDTPTIRLRASSRIST